MSEVLAFSTDHLAPKERFDTWRGYGIDVAGVVITPRGETPLFRGDCRAQQKGALLRFTCQSDFAHVSRGRSEISRHPKDCYFLYRELSGGAHFRFAQRDLATRRGGLLVADLDQPYVTQPTGERFRHEVMYVPKRLLDPYLPTQIERFGLLSESPGLDNLAASSFDALWREWEDIPEAALPLAADTLCRLIGLAFGAAPGDHGEAVRSGQLAQARHFIDSHLTEPDLSAARTAAALRISERKLYALFEGDGTSFAVHVRRRRLEECRAALLANPRRPVMDIALSWGFGSMPSFYRAFQAAYGLSPGELREVTADAF